MAYADHLGVTAASKAGCEHTVTELCLKNCNSELYPKETVFTSERKAVGKLNMPQRPMVMGQSWYALVGKNRPNQLFVYAAMQAIVEALRQHFFGMAFDAIVVDPFKRVNLLIAPAPTFRLLRESFSPLFDLVENPTLQNQKLCAARDLLLTRLINGELAA